ncbi:Voltage-dependent calcium channel subunit alpha-2/delta-2 [Clarias magur]|uniref:Voltage-dependent calcium channel subunit alpha-2/delta-2 n=1 Tax=Clarias magur TaxID=1594786 RepID=A0A8J4X9N6_CLAMG|nr:Voltage-dependent calcium channel subunit alpha-2/delta-2 [Clarias magur]
MAGNFWARSGRLTRVGVNKNNERRQRRRRRRRSFYRRDSRQDRYRYQPPRVEVLREAGILLGVAMQSFLG